MVTSTMRSGATPPTRGRCRGWSGPGWRRTAAGRCAAGPGRAGSRCGPSHAPAVGRGDRPDAARPGASRRSRASAISGISARASGRSRGPDQHLQERQLADIDKRREGDVGLRGAGRRARRWPPDRPGYPPGTSRDPARWSRRLALGQLRRRLAGGVHGDPEGLFRPDSLGRADVDRSQTDADRERRIGEQDDGGRGGADRGHAADQSAAGHHRLAKGDPALVPLSMVTEFSKLENPLSITATGTVGMEPTKGRCSVANSCSAADCSAAA